MAGRRGLFVRKDATAGTSPQDARLAIAGLVTGAGDLGVVPGVISGCAVTGNASWQYTVGAGHLVGTRGASDGASVFAVDGPTLTSAVAAAPASGSRYDLVWVRQRDVDNADADSQVQVGVTSGTASGSPSRPTAQVPAGAVVVAEALVSAGATQTAHANVTITPLAVRVAARGGIIPVPNAAVRDLLSGAATAQNPITVDRLDLDNVFERNSGAGWTRVGGPTRAWVATLAVGTPIDVTGGNAVVSLTVPVKAGRSYRVTAAAEPQQAGPTPSSLATVRLLRDSNVVVPGLMINRSAGVGEFLEAGTVSPVITAASDGNSTFVITANTQAGALRFANGTAQITVEEISL